MKNNIVKVAAVVGVILLIPLFGNLYIEGWNWDLLDFIVMGALLFLTGLGILTVSQKLANPAHKALAIIVIVVAFLAIWVEMAVDGVSQLLQAL